MSIQPEDYRPWQDLGHVMPAHKRANLVGFSEYNYLESHVTENLLDSLCEKEGLDSPTHHLLFELNWIGKSRELPDWYQYIWLAPRSSNPSRMNQLYHILTSYYRQLHKPQHRDLRQKLQNEYITFWSACIEAECAQVDTL